MFNKIATVRLHIRKFGSISLTVEVLYLAKAVNIFALLLFSSTPSFFPTPSPQHHV